MINFHYINIHKAAPASSLPTKGPRTNGRGMPSRKRRIWAASEGGASTCQKLTFFMRFSVAFPNYTVWTLCVFLWNSIRSQKREVGVFLLGSDFGDEVSRLTMKLAYGVLLFYFLSGLSPGSPSTNYYPMIIPLSYHICKTVVFSFLYIFQMAWDALIISLRAISLLNCKSLLCHKAVSVYHDFKG